MALDSNSEGERDETIQPAASADLEEYKEYKGDDSAASFVSSLSSGSNDPTASSPSRAPPAPATFDNGMLIKSVNDSVFLRYAADSLREALGFIDEATDETQSWIDARDVLDRTAAALDDAGLALRSLHQKRMDSLSSGADTSAAVAGGGETSAEAGDVGGTGRKASFDGSEKSKDSSGSYNLVVAKEEALVRKLADEVIEKRKTLLGNVLVHDADGPWAKMQYGEHLDGVSFHDAVLTPVPLEDKESKALLTWASQTGTAKKFAKKLHKFLGGDDRCILRPMEDLTVQDLAKYKRVYIVCSTFGCGRPPRDGELFYAALQLATMKFEENPLDRSLEDVTSNEQKVLHGTSVAIAALGSSKFGRNFAAFGFGLAAELMALGAELCGDGVTTMDAKTTLRAKEQKVDFKDWAVKVQEMENERLGNLATKRPGYREFRRPSIEKQLKKIPSFRSFKKASSLKQVNADPQDDATDKAQNSAGVMKGTATAEVAPPPNTSALSQSV